MAATEVELIVDTLDAPTEIAVAMTATLLLRLEDAAPQLFLTAPNTRTVKLPLLGDGDLFSELAGAHDGFRAAARFRRGRARRVDLRLVFGRAETQGLSVNTAGWACALGAGLPAIPGNPIASAFAGVLASSEALRVAFLKAGSQVRTRPFRGAVSLWDYSLEPNVGPVIQSPVDLAGFGIVGCGGVASATAWALGLLALKGTPLVVDPDVIDDKATNLNRHLTATFQHLSESKADLLAALLRDAGASPRAQKHRWDAVSEEERAGVATGIITVDRDAVRRQFQLDMPRAILNGGTSDTGYYRVTYHDFLTAACLRCVSHGDEQSGGQVANTARRLGISTAYLSSLIAENGSLPDDVLSRLPAADREFLYGVRGTNLVETVCAKLQPLPDEPAVSAPMLSAAPGVVIAGEIVKRSADVDAPLQPSRNAVGCNILKGPHGRWVMGIEKRHGCECLDPIYRQHYANKWPRPGE
jgi:hypothetical protein